MLARAIVLVAAAGALVFGVTQLREIRRCDADEYTLLVALVQHRPPPHGLAALVDEVGADCHDPVALRSASGVLTSSGHYGPALALARLDVHRYPRSQAGWAALAQVLDRIDPAGAARARARVRALNPQAVVPPASYGIRPYG